MSDLPFHLLLRHIHRMAGSTDQPADRDLLQRFAVQHDAAAFEELLSRHGPRVLGVCRRLLSREQDVEDVFQATFLVLARQAGTVRRPDAVGCYLHGVAARLALKVRCASAHAPASLPEGVAGPGSAPPDEVTLREARAILEEELAALPERYRRPLVLCYLEGRKRSEAAAALGWSLGTLKRRLGQGRAALGRHLTRRGLTLSGALLAALCPSTQAAPPVGLTAAAARTAVAVSRGQSLAGLVSTTAAALADKAIPAALAAKLAGTVFLLTLFVVAAGAAVLSQPHPRAEPTSAPPPRATVKVEEERTDRFGDPLPPGVRVRLGTIRLRHEVFRFSFSPDGKQLASAGRDGLVRLWDLATGKEIRRFGGHREYAYSVAFSPDGKLLASGDVFHVHLWDLASGRKVRTLAPFEPEPGKPKPELHLVGVYSLAFSPDGKALLVSAGDNCLGLWDVAAGRLLSRIDDGAHDYAGFLPDGKRLACVGGGQFSIRSRDGKVLQRITLGYPRAVVRVAVTREGRWLACSKRRDILQGNISVGERGVLSLWDMSTEKELWRVETPHPPYGLALSPDGKTLAYAEDRTIHLVERATGKEVRCIEGAEGETLLLGFSPDGMTLAAHGRGSLHLWEAATGRPLLNHVGHAAEVVFTAFTPDGSRLISASGEDQTARVWDTATGRQLSGWSGGWAAWGRPAITLEARGTVLLAGVGPNRIGRWQVPSGRRLPERRIVESPANPFAHERMTLGLTPDGRTLVSVSDKNTRDGSATVLLQEAESGKVRLQRTYRLPQRERRLPILSPDGRLMAETARDRILLRDVAGGEVRRALRVDGIGQGSFEGATPVFAPSGRLLACVSTPKDSLSPQRRQVHLWELATGKELAAISIPYAPRLAFSADGLVLASAAGDYGEHRPVQPRIHLWSTASGRQLAEVGPPDALVRSLAFSADGGTLATGLTNSTVLLWDLASIRKRAAGPERVLGAEELARLWDDLGSEHAGRAYAAVEALAGSPAESLPFLRERMQPALGVKEERVRRLLVDLDSDRFAVRQAALEALERLDTLVEAVLEELLRQGPSLERRRRAEYLLEKMHGPLRTVEARRAVRAVAVLEATNTREARRLLKTLAEGAAGARLTREVAAALERLQEWESGSLHP